MTEATEKKLKKAKKKNAKTQKQEQPLKHGLSWINRHNTLVFFGGVAVGFTTLALLAAL